MTSKSYLSRCGIKKMKLARGFGGEAVIRARAYLEQQARDIIDQHEVGQLVTILRQLRLLRVAARAMHDCPGVTTEQLAASGALEAAVKAADDPACLCNSEDYIHKLQTDGAL